MFVAKLFKFRKKTAVDVTTLLRMQGATIGSNVHFADTILDPSYPFLIEIGDNSVLSACRVLTHDASSMSALGYSRVGRVIIGKDCFIGADAILLPGTIIGDRVIIGAGAIVCGKVESNGVYVGQGSSLRKVASYDEYVEKMRHLFDKGQVFDVSRANLTKEIKKDILSKLAQGEIGFMK